MLNKNLIKIIFIMFILFFVFSNTFACSAISFDPTEDPNSWQPTISDEGELTEKAGAVLNIISTVGIICSVIVLVILGLKYMLGSVQEKAEYKKSMIPYLIGLFLLAACTALPSIIYNIVNSGSFFG